MKRRPLGFRDCLLTLLVVCSLPAVALPQNRPAPVTVPNAPSYDAPSFAAELRALTSEINEAHDSPAKLDSVKQHLAPKWVVTTPEGHYEISSEPLRSLLSTAEKEAATRHQPAREAQTWVADLLKQVQGYERQTAAHSPDARLKLDEILRRREFKTVHPPTAWELFRERMNEWLLRFFQRLFDSIARHPLGAKVLFWMILLGAVAWLATMLFRFWSRLERFEEMQTIGTVASRRSWQEWIRAARAAAERGDFREAVHSTYWAGIAYLQESGAVSPDRTRTPREYLGLLSTSDGGATPIEPKQRESLAALTSRLERIWYGLRPASADDFRDCLQRVEELGCRLP